MRLTSRSWTVPLWLLVSASALLAQAPAAPPNTQPPPPFVEAYVATMEIKALAPEMKSAKPNPEAEAVMSSLRQQSQLVSKIFLTTNLSRQEIVSTDFVLPAGTLVLHEAGAKFYAIADPKAKTYLVMDSEGLLNALEGGAGIVNTAYDARVVHTPEKKLIAGFECRKSVVTVTYASQIPMEASTVLVQQKNDIEVWHTPQLVSTAATDHFFFKFQRDKTGAVRKVLGQEIGFPMEVSFVVTQGAAGAKRNVQPGSFKMAITELKVEKRLESELFRIPPAGYRRVEKNPYFQAGAQSNAGAEMSGEPPKKP